MMNRWAGARVGLGVAVVGVMCAASVGQPQAGAQPGAQLGSGPAVRGDRSHVLVESMLRNQVQLTFREQFMKAGEAYFSPDGARVIFQAIAVPKAGEQAEPYYSMYVADLARSGDGHVTGLANIRRVSPANTANTCGWFHPTDPEVVLFASTVVRPSDEQKSGFQVGTNRYRWMFPQEMEVVTARLEPGRIGEPGVKAVFEQPNYDAECSYSPDGRFVLYVRVEDELAMGRPDANIYVFDTQTGKHHGLVTEPGYDGGPFFSPDGKSICFRSDRKGNDLLQLFVAELRFEDGVPVGVEREYQITDNADVNWAPYWHPSGEFLVYATSAMGHRNYEVFAIEVDLESMRAGLRQPTDMRTAQVTHMEGADILPAFSNDGKLFMWTSQQAGKAADEERASSQLWIAEWVGRPFPALEGHP